ncbi:hypothetical protein BN7_1230 [Wickerhamomyces ciferrii]|uniref:RNase III domain-containing protein n=1 Tax=Wickerhamomyces ciferrii (strain ATCC 14091 / BCRC 22168 / CBS 111 / JCM 3599 / NBRC 0793 / NRRL Y-1031 F-60-10) TaxID=1206466 RepID=K0KJN2_WICCF|nr:uncharacterized protein BN7_1230 [Wickerhamomyces ciferrii]CCH41689.1 hypothetical protein BN7_1230 [Wickerhamomyces ciferrii]
MLLAKPIFIVRPPFLKNIHSFSRSLHTNQRYIHQTIKSPNIQQSTDENFNLSRSLLSTDPVKCGDYIIPPLPLITNDAIYRQVFDFSLELVQPDELPDGSSKLEWLGDAFFSDSLINMMKPMVQTESLKSQGYDSNIVFQDDETKEYNIHYYEFNSKKVPKSYLGELQSNSIMAEWSNAYGLVNMIYPKIKRDNLLGKKIDHKNHADIFESYIGGLYLNYKDDLKIVNEYIKELIMASIPMLRGR